MKSNNKKITEMTRNKYLVFVLCVVFSFSAAFAQKTLVKGVVKSTEDNLPVIGVSVLVKGTNVGTITDLDGKYSVTAKNGDIIQFSYIGLTTQELKVTGPVLNVLLMPSAVALDEVVAIGYGTVKKKELTGAVAQVKAEDLSNIITSDLGAALQGQISGVNIVSSSGAPGSASEILIRGISSVSGSNTPLFVVDGVPQESDPRLSTNEIETIDVLKDAASCAIYGTRGAAGVILITTKQGKAGVMKISADGSYGIQHITSSIPLMNSVEQTYFDIVYNRNLNPNLTDADFVLNLSKYATGFQYDTDLSKTVFVNNAPTQNYNVNISGGTKDLSYNVTAGYFKTDGIIRNSGFERFNTRINTTYKTNKWVVGASLGLTSEQTAKTANNMIVQTIKYYPTQADLDLNNNDPLISIVGDVGTRLGSVLESFNTENNARNIKTNANFNAKYTITKALSVSTRLGLNLTTDYGKIFRPYKVIYDIYGTLIGSPENSYITMTSSLRTSMSWDGGLNYVKSFKNHKLTGFLGLSTEVYTFDQFVASRTGVIDNSIKVLNYAALNQSATSGNNYTKKLLGKIARLQYDYQGKYLVSATLRHDGSSMFNSDNYYGFFPSASGAWNVSDEEFWKPYSKVVSNLKLRASYGTTGNQNFPTYMNAAAIESGYDYAFGASGSEVMNLGSIQSQLANPTVIWETSIQSNIGIDLAFYNNKFTMSAEYYNTKKKDMLFPIGLPGSVGAGTNANVTLNVGNMTNDGFEFSTVYKARTGKVNWNFNGTFSTNSNVITKMSGEGNFRYTDDSGLISGAKTQSQITVLAEGYEAGAFFLYKTDGIVNTEEKLADYQKLNANARMGDLIFIDTDKDGKITDSDRVYSGSGLPRYEAGLTIRADYNNFDFSTQLYTALGHEIMNGSKATAYSYGRHKDLLYGWSEANPLSPIPAYRGDVKAHDNFKGYTDQWLEDGSFLRIKNVTLGYSLDKKTVSKLKMSKIRVYITAQNLYTLTKYTGYDPEIGGGVASRGLDKGNYPITSLYTAGLNINF